MNTTKIAELAQNVAADKEIQKDLKKMDYPLTNTEFVDAANNYISAIKEGRMLCTIPKVSASGMSRQIKFHSFEIYGNGTTKNSPQVGYYRQYWAFFKALGYSEARGNKDAFTIGGCGMNMIFHTNYTIIHRLTRLGFLTKEECDTLAQQ